MNLELADLYWTVRDQPKGLLRWLRFHERLHRTHGKLHYLGIRGSKPPYAEERASRTLYLNRTCFNGLYRLNKKGEFNVPLGDYKNPKILDEEGIMAASEALQGVTIGCYGFENSSLLTPGDAIYLDPPYLPVSKTSNFSAYTGHTFGEADHRRLASHFNRLVATGATVILSNSDTPLSRELYAGHDIRTVEMARSINSKGAKRGKVNEILVVGKVEACHQKKTA
jgi:DNA adenine methylase